MEIQRHLLTLYTRAPLHIGSGVSVDVVDLPIVRERITGFPFIPATSLKGVLLQHARETLDDGTHARRESIPEDARILFGAIENQNGQDGQSRQVSNAGCVQIMEGKLLAFPVRSLAGCFAWITCPAVLKRFQRDTGIRFDVPDPGKDKAVVPGDSDLTEPNEALAILEEHVIKTGKSADARAVADELARHCSDPLWKDSLGKRLAVLHDENFQHFVTTCAEVVTRIAINPATRTVKGADGGGGGALFNQENIPSETLFYSVLTVLPPRRGGLPEGFDPNKKLAELLTQPSPPILQIGGDETTGHGLCETQFKPLGKKEAK
jgi:CRISPR-associated protein Cmr4